MHCLGEVGLQLGVAEDPGQLENYSVEEEEGGVFNGANVGSH